VSACEHLYCNTFPRLRLPSVAGITDLDSRVLSNSLRNANRPSIRTRPAHTSTFVRAFNAPLAPTSLSNGNSLYTSGCHRHWHHRRPRPVQPPPRCQSQWAQRDEATSESHCYLPAHIRHPTGTYFRVELRHSGTHHHLFKVPSSCCVQPFAPV
jgi:hypothetical protein